MSKSVFSVCGALFAALVTLFSTQSPAAAGDKVVVSTPALHSLVATLLEGVGTPALLFSNKDALSDPVPDADALAAIEAAEMVIWAGPEYEQALAGIRTLDASIGFKSLTLSATTPLISMSEAGNADRPSGRHDMRFWLDPRLAKLAVSRIASNLVRVYPDGGDRILDNEIVLKKRLAALEKSMRDALDAPHGAPVHVPESDILYLAWRFNLEAPNCPAAAAKIEAFGQTAGIDLYFAMMAQVLEDLQRCRPANRPAS
ncbi:MAG: hypothetical protein C0606_00335 [Hyphomicrobiales bacterium]|nr:MAG: hypothetical protein C0606_00335 [Hyphomicrobiales bacterium]